MQVVVAEGGLKVEESEPNPALVAHMLTKLDWAVFRDTAREVRGDASAATPGRIPCRLCVGFLCERRLPASARPCFPTTVSRYCGSVRRVAQVCGSLVALPDDIPADVAADAAFTTAVHRALMDVHVMSGHLECPSCKRQYPIVNGVPNLLLHEDEVGKK